MCLQAVCQAFFTCFAMFFLEFLFSDSTGLSAILPQQPLLTAGERFFGIPQSLRRFPHAEGAALLSSGQASHPCRLPSGEGSPVSWFCDVRFGFFWVRTGTGGVFQKALPPDPAYNRGTAFLRFCKACRLPGRGPPGCRRVPLSRRRALHTARPNRQRYLPGYNKAGC